MTKILNSWQEVEKICPVTPKSLGCDEFKRDHRCKWAYYVGSMYRGIASVSLVVRAAKAGILSFFGSAGFSQSDLEKHIQNLQSQLTEADPYGVCLLANLEEPQVEMQTIELFLKYHIRQVEASAFSAITESLVYYRAKGLSKNGSEINIANKITAKISRPEVALQFLSPCPEKLLAGLVAKNLITEEQALLAKKVPLADNITAEANSGGHTDNGVAFALYPTIIRMRNEMQKNNPYSQKIRIGAAGGIGTPESIAAAFAMGVDYVVTGSVNQCSVEAGTSDLVKDLLADMNIQDTLLVPAGDMFEIGARVQVLKKGLLFPARALLLYDVYKYNDSIEAIDEKTRSKIENTYFKKTFEEIWNETKAYWKQRNPKEIEKAEKNPKIKMALLLRWYFGLSMRLAFEGNMEKKVDFQIHTGPALGSFNQWLKGSKYEDWRCRHVDTIATLLMESASRIVCLNALKCIGYKPSEELLLQASLPTIA